MQTIQQRLRSLQKPSQRKLRLFAVACCWEIWPLLKDQRSQQVVQVAEAYADGLATSHELTVAAHAATAVIWPEAAAAVDTAAAAATAAAAGDAARAAIYVAWTDAWNAARTAAAYAAWSATYAGVALQQMESKQHLLLDDIFTFSTKLIESRAAQQMAQSLYDTKDFASLPVLADYLEEHEYQDQEVLAHCRSDLPHVKGCWALDAILGKH